MGRVEERTMQVSKLMTRDARIASPAQSLQQAAQVIAELDTGVLPVGENDRLVGMITDRDITIRAVAMGRSSDTPIREVMSPKVESVFEDQEADEVRLIMSHLQMRRLPVLDRNQAAGWQPVARRDCDFAAGAGRSWRGIERRVATLCKRKARSQRAMWVTDPHKQARGRLGTIKNVCG